MNSASLARRALILLGAVPLVARPTPGRAPTDIDELNAFARAHNKYLERLREGIVDVRQWRRVEEAWTRLAH
jgi:hypothetical protein